MPNSKSLLVGALVFVLLVAAAVLVPVGLKASYIIGPTGPSPITPSLGTPAFVQALDAHTTTTPTSFSGSFGGLPAVGDVVVVIGLTGNSGSSEDVNLVITDNQGTGNGNGYTRLQINQTGLGFFPRLTMWCAPVVTSAGTFTITMAENGTNFFPGFLALEYSGTSCNMDKFAVANGATSPYSCGSITTVNPKDLVLAAVFAAGATGTTTFTAPTGFTIRKSQPTASLGQVASVADDIVAATNTFTPTYGTGQNHASTPCTVAALLSQ